MVVSKDDLIIRFLNGAALASLGGRKGDLIGRSVKEVLPDGGWADHFLRVATTGEPIMGTGSVGPGSPGHRDNHWVIVPTGEEAGGELALIIIDSTHQMKEPLGEISGEMIQEGRMLKTIVDTMPTGVILTDRDGRIWHSNRLAEFLLSSTREGSPEQSLFEGADQDDRRMEIGDWPLFKALHHDQTTLGKEVKVRGSSGEVRTVLTSAAPLRSEDGSLLGAVSVFQDITEMKDVEEKFWEQTEELTRSNAELQHFAYIASHDLKEPLRMVVSYVQLLNKHYGDRIDGKGRDYLRYAAEGAERMKEMIDDLLEYSRVGSGNELFSQVDMMKVAQKVKDDLRISIGETGASVTWGELPTITAVESQMIKLLENLVGNSIKYHDVAAPQIEVSARMTGISWLFSVRDNGIGIDPRHADRLFKMFHRLHTRDEYPGTGLGLALARRIVERHGGSIWYESEVGKGTTFFFTISVDRRIRGRINHP
jgi:PAS domain S-box-containing protein